jgi:hypothetical protein
VLLRDVPPHVPGGQEDAPDSKAAGEEIPGARHPGSLVVLVLSVVVPAVVIVVAASAACGANPAAATVVIIIVVVPGGRRRRWGRLRVRDHRLRRRRGRRRRRRRRALRRFLHGGLCGRRGCGSRLRSRSRCDRPDEHLPHDDARLRRHLLRHDGALDRWGDPNDELALRLRGPRRADRRDGFLMRDHMSGDVEQAGERRSQQ